MKHARQDYQRIQDPAANAELLSAFDEAMNLVARGHGGMNPEHSRVLSKLCRALSPILSPLVTRKTQTISAPIAADEPVFLLRAKDRHAPDTIRRWAELVYARGKGNGDMSSMAMDHADTMERWQREHGCKDPDLPGQPENHPQMAL
jgi:hypothetical protein